MLAQIAEIPADAQDVGRAATRGTVTAVATDSRVWLFEDEFVELPAIPDIQIDYLGWVGDSVAVWDNTEGALFVYDGDKQTWSETKVAKKYIERTSPALCAFETGFALWGGWTKPDEASGVVVARDTGIIIEIEANDG